MSLPLARLSGPDETIFNNCAVMQGAPYPLCMGGGNCMVGRPPPVADPHLVTQGLAYRFTHSKKGKKLPTWIFVLAALVFAAFVAGAIYLIFFF